MSPWKKWSWISRTRSPSFDRFPFYYTSIFMILQPLRSGYHEIKVNELPDWDWAWSDETKAANWGSLKGYLCECFYLSSYIQHVSMHFEKSRRLSVLWTIWDFSMISAEKVPGSWFDFCHHRGVDFASMTYKVATNEECSISEIWEIAVFLYNWLASPWELTDKTGTWKVEQKRTVARPWS